MNSTRVKVGEVSVDSGSLVIVDPVYIENLWKRQSESTPMGVYFWGADADRLANYLRKKEGRVVVHNARHDAYLASLKSVGSLEWLLGYIDAFVTDGYSIAYEVAYKDDSYDEAFWARDNENGAGEVDHIDGIVTETGYGDGTYEVYATRVETDEGRRTQKIEVEFF